MAGPPSVGPRDARNTRTKIGSGDAQYPVGKGYDANLDSNSPAFKDSTGGKQSGGGRAKPATHGVAGGVVSAKKTPDLAVSMKQMLRRKGGSK